MPEAKLAAAHGMLSVIKVCYIQCQLDLAALLELSKASIAGLTFQAGVHNTDFVKALTVAFRNMFEDSKVARPKNDNDLDALTVQWLYACANLQRGVKDATAELQVHTQDKVQMPPTAVSRVVDDILSDMEAKSTVFSELHWQICERLVGPLVESITSEKFELQDVAVEDADANKFKSSLNGVKSVDGASLQCAVVEADLVNICESVHTTVTRLLNIRKIEAWNQGLSKLPKKKISLKFGRGITNYVERSIIPSLVLEDIEDVKSNLLPALEDIYALSVTSVQSSMKRPKVAKGCIDFGPNTMRLRECVFDHIKKIFKLYGAEAIDTPIFELKEVLTGKYGEDSKLIYDLKDQGGEQLSLRYDLTVPFARYCGTNGVEKLTRYHIGKVYRRDEPQLNRGRYREFFQCDVDIAGPGYDPMIPEAEILSLLCHALDSMQKIIGQYTIKVSHRLLLNGMMQFCEVPETSIRAISSAIDKLDKEPWAAVRDEMVKVKHLDPIVADRLESIVCFAGSIPEISDKLRALEIEGKLLTSNASVTQALLEMELLHKMLPAGVAQRLQFNTSLARGLDYYTGLIYEAVMFSGSEQFGSIAAGGRYDNLIGMFSGKNIPAVGVSLGIERVFRLIEERVKASDNTLTLDGTSIPVPRCDCYIASVGSIDFGAKIAVAKILRQAGISCEYALKGKVALKKELQTVLDLKCSVVVIVGETEYAEGKVKIKTMSYDSAGQSTETEVPTEKSAEFIKNILDTHRTKLAEFLFQ